MPIMFVIHIGWKSTRNHIKMFKCLKLNQRELNLIRSNVLNLCEFLCTYSCKMVSFMHFVIIVEHYIDLISHPPNLLKTLVGYLTASSLGL